VAPRGGGGRGSGHGWHVVGRPPRSARQWQAREAAGNVEQGKGGREGERRCGWHVRRLGGVGPSRREGEGTSERG
jgi:hypothetical protein